MAAAGSELFISSDCNPIHSLCKKIPMPRKVANEAEHEVRQKRRLQTIKVLDWCLKNEEKSGDVFESIERREAQSRVQTNLGEKWSTTFKKMHKIPAPWWRSWMSSYKPETFSEEVLKKVAAFNENNIPHMGHHLTGTSPGDRMCPEMLFQARRVTKFNQTFFPFKWFRKVSDPPFQPDRPV